MKTPTKAKSTRGKATQSAGARKAGKGAGRELRLIQKMRAKKTNLMKIHASMSRLCVDAVDREVLKRFKVIIDTMEEDITKKKMNQVLKDPLSVSLSDFDENIQPYIKHYLFLIKREKRTK